MFFILFGVTVLLHAVVGFLFTRKVSWKYPELYKKYDSPDGFFITTKNATFFGEVVYSSLYKELIEQVDYKYIYSLRLIVSVCMIAFVIILFK